MLIERIYYAIQYAKKEGKTIYSKHNHLQKGLP